MMKSYIVAISLLLPFALLAANSKIEMGLTKEQTIEAMGKPQGVIHLPDKTLLLYAEGEITIRDSAVSKIDLMSDAQFAQDQERAKQERAEWAVQQEKLAADRIKAGEKLKAYKLQNSTFAALPAKDRIDYWRSFQIKFPQVDVSPEIASALASYQIEIAELKTQQRIAELKTSVALAQKETEVARLETEKLRAETKARNDASNYRLRDDYTPSYNYPPQRIIIHSNHYEKRKIYDKECWNYKNFNLPQQRSRTTTQNMAQFITN
ncbi:MAG: hypothetical protein ACI8Z5_002405 [Lentimonas sp.]|jgi:hypothetical protein